MSEMWPDGIRAVKAMESKSLQYPVAAGSPSEADRGDEDSAGSRKIILMTPCISGVFVFS